jgi:hypothetical protein
MFRFTLKRFVALAVLSVTISLAVAAPANATYGLSKSPMYRITSTTWCGYYNGIMVPGFWIDGANLNQYLQETQRIYVQFAFYTSATGTIADSTYYYGYSHGMDISTRESMDHVQTWYDAYTNQQQSDAFFGIYNRGHGTYQVAMRFAWDRSSSGAPSSLVQLPTANRGWTNWIWLPGTCTF